METIKLYLCDGKACENMDIPGLCYMNGGKCCHTSNKEHSLKEKLGDKLPETIFVPICDGKAFENMDTPTNKISKIQKEDVSAYDFITFLYNNINAEERNDDGNHI